MLPKQHRLPTSETKVVIRRGRRASAGGVHIIFTPNVLPVSRFAFIVPISVDKRAVVRNRIRRLVRESVRLALPNVAKGRDAVFFVRKAFADEFGQADKRVREALQKAGLL